MSARVITATIRAVLCAALAQVITREDAMWSGRWWLVYTLLWGIVTVGDWVGFIYTDEKCLKESE